MGIFRTNNPMQYAEVDGIVIDERAPVPGISGAGTGVAILIGHFNRGPINQLTEVSSRADIIDMFGDNSLGYTALLNKRFSRIKILRVNQVVAVHATHTITLNNMGGSIVFTAVAPGTAGNDLTITIQAPSSGDGKIYQFAQGGTTEFFQSTVEGLEDAVQRSTTLVTVEVNNVGTVTDPANLAATAFTGGTDAVPATDADYVTALSNIEEPAAGNVVFLDEYNAARNTALLAHANVTRDRMVICAGPEEETVAQAVTAVESLRDVDGRVIYAYNWLQTNVGGTQTFVSPASFMASIISNTSAHVDPAFVANSQFLFGVSGIKHTLSRADSINLLNAGVASFEFDPDIGYKVKSGVVTQILDSSKTQILRRRMADYLTASIGRFLKVYQNAPNNEVNRQAVKAAILRFIQGDEEAGILPKDSEVNDGVAKLVDITSMNTNESIAQGRFLINYRQRIYSSMRFIVLIAEIGQSVVVTEGE